MPGDFMEAGVFKGGTPSRHGRADAHRQSSRSRGRCGWPTRSDLPALDTGRIGDAKTAGFVRTETAKAKWHKGRFSVPERTVRANLHRCLPRAASEGAVRTLPGYFNQSLPGPVKRLALLRIDADMYTSIMDVLERVYDLVAPGGFVVFDDYKFPQAQSQAYTRTSARGARWPRRSSFTMTH